MPPARDFFLAFFLFFLFFFPCCVQFCLNVLAECRIFFVVQGRSLVYGLRGPIVRTVVQGQVVGSACSIGFMSATREPIRLFESSEWILVEFKFRVGALFGPNLECRNVFERTCCKVCYAHKRGLESKCFPVLQFFLAPVRRIPE